MGLADEVILEISRSQIIGLDDYEQVEVLDVLELRAWLTSNWERTTGVWLIYHKKESPHYLAWSDMVDQLLCFGWIDSTARKLDDKRTMRLIAPRKKKSLWSRINKEKIQRLATAGLMAEGGEAAVAAAKEDGSWTVYDEIEDLIVPSDLQEVLDSDHTLGASWDGYSASLKKGHLWRLKEAKTEQTRKKRLEKTVRYLRENIREIP